MKTIIKYLRERFVFYRVNVIYRGTHFFERKRKLLNSIGFRIGRGTRIVGPIEVTGNLIVGNDCWIGKDFKVNGNGTVVIGNNCDIGPEVTFQTGGHVIGNKKRRAGDGMIFQQSVGDGCWICGGVTIFNNTKIGESCVIAGRACVVKDVDNNSLVGGVPAQLIRRLEE